MTYDEFRRRFDVNLNQQQEDAVKAIDGANLILAVPGSGKTTVLVTRLGYMTVCLGIPAENILAVTYNKAAAIEMKERFDRRFGSDMGVKFCTINSLSYEIYRRNCALNGLQQRNMLMEGARKRLIAEIYQSMFNKRATEPEAQEIGSMIAYAKNMCLRPEELEMFEDDIPCAEKIYSEYKRRLKENGYMDFDDQMLYAYYILLKSPQTLAALRKRYRYLCVDEAQDVSKLQHMIIRLLAEGNSIFMVGDEDQSIYGFRAAYPKALLGFEREYKNAHVLRMEKNYRSTEKIVSMAQAFIEKNTDRYDKKMTPVRLGGETPALISVSSRAEQFKELVKLCERVENCKKGENAILFRDNETAAVLVDELCEKGIPYSYKGAQTNFFRSAVVADICAYLRLSLSEYDTDAFERVCNKGIFYLSPKQRYIMIDRSRKRGMSVLDTAEEMLRHYDDSASEKLKKLRYTLRTAAMAKPAEAIDIIRSSGYEKYLKRRGADTAKTEALKIIASRKPDIKSFLKRVSELESLTEKGSDCPHGVILSTIHSSKGLEYDNVYLADVYDGRFPSLDSIEFRSRSGGEKNISSVKKNINAAGTNDEQEERRLFYVGVTRAKNRLFIYSIKNRPSSFADEFYGIQRKPAKSRKDPTGITGKFKVIYDGKKLVKVPIP